MSAIPIVRPIHTEEDYQAALKAIRPYIENEPEPGTAEADHYDLLALVIGKYEDDHFPIEAGDPVDVVRLVMEEGGHSRAELADLLGGQPRVTEFFKGRRDLTLPQIRRIRDSWKIPADLLIGPGA